MSSRRVYRDLIKNKNMVSFTVNVKETDLWVAVDDAHYSDDLKGLVEEYIWMKRRELERFIRDYPEFKEALHPYLMKEAQVPDIVIKMIQAGNTVNVGPMATVAGIFSEIAGSFLLDRVKEVIVENGGDIFMKISKPCRVGIYAGNSPLSGKLALEISPEDTPLGICTSSGTVGHSFSRGKADAVAVVSPSVPLADAAATALANQVNSKEKLQDVIQKAQNIEGINGVLIICEDKMAVWGQIKLC